MAIELREFIIEKNSEGDEELTYVSLMKYFLLVSILHSRRQSCSEYKYLIDRVLGSRTGWKRKVDLRRQLKGSLERRYTGAGSIMVITALYMLI